LRGKRGIIWLRYGSSTPNDIDVFAHDALPFLSGPTVLVTTDGDLSIPAELTPEVVTAILNSKHIVAWYSQNLVIGEYEHHDNDKMKHMPIGGGLVVRTRAVVLRFGLGEVCIARGAPSWVFRDHMDVLSPAAQAAMMGSGLIYIGSKDAFHTGFQAPPAISLLPEYFHGDILLWPPDNVIESHEVYRNI